MLIDPVKAPGRWRLSGIDRDGLVDFNVFHVWIMDQPVERLLRQRGSKTGQCCGIDKMDGCPVTPRLFDRSTHAFTGGSRFEYDDVFA